MTINIINHIIDNLYASSKEIAENNEILSKYNIQIIISLNGQAFNYSNITSYTFDTEDDPNYNIIEHYQEIFNIINNDNDNNNDNNNNILVHCDAGVSRTGGFVIYYLMNKHNMNYNEALLYAINKRQCISPNNGFELNLRLLELNNSDNTDNNDNNNDNELINSDFGVHFIYYNELVDFLNQNKKQNTINYIIGIGNGMIYGNSCYKIDNNIDDLLENYNDIKEEINNVNNNVVIYGTKYLIDMIKNIYYHKNDNITNEEYDKITNLGLSKSKSKSKFNIFNINLIELNDYKKSDLHQLLYKLDGYISKNINERNHKKQIVTKIEKLLKLLLKSILLKE